MLTSRLGCPSGYGVGLKFIKGMHAWVQTPLLTPIFHRNTFKGGYFGTSINQETSQFGIWLKIHCFITKD